MLSLSLDFTEKGQKQVYSCAINSEHLVAAGNSDGSTTLLKPDGKVVLKNHKYPVTALCFTSTHLITASSDHTIVMWDLATGSVTEKLLLHKGPVRCLCTSHDGSLLISGSSDQTVCITNLLTNPPQVIRHLKQTESDSGMLSGLCISNDNTTLISTATSGTLFVYDINDTRPRHSQYNSHEMGVNGCDVKMLQEKHVLCTVGADYLVKLWNIEDDFSLSLCTTMSGHTGQVLCCKFAVLPDNRDALFTGSVDKTVIVWDLETGGKLHQSICHSSFVYSIALQDDKLVSCSSDKTVKRWTVTSGKVRTINVIPIAHQDKLLDWSNKQVKSWLQHILPEAETTLTGVELVNQDLEELVNELGNDDVVQDKLRRSILLLRCFDGAPPEFLCPISMEIMTDPVISTDGHSYERSNITEWLAAGHNTSPFTNTTLSTNSLITNHNLRKIIQTAFLIE